ncbi:MAG: hypothetical protein OIF40_08775 [Mangrovicoccus sp.]|nr:hypothetical protein [Mangrovicoccus sp.]
MIAELSIMGLGLLFSGAVFWMARRETKRFDERHASKHHPAE